MKLTKKVINEAPKYIICVDPRTTEHEIRDNMKKQGFYVVLTSAGDLYYKTLDSNDLLFAMAEAEQYFTEDIFMIRISEKNGTVDQDTQGIVYQDILASRREEHWHLCDEDHGEDRWRVAYNPEYKFFQGLGKVE